MSEPITTTPAFAPALGVKRPPGPRTLSPLSSASALQLISVSPYAFSSPDGFFSVNLEYSYHSIHDIWSEKKHCARPGHLW
jgi:hypothetical protein